MTGAERIAAAILAAKSPAITAFLTAGYPDLDGFADRLRAVAEAADVVEIGVPFTDPMADGVTIQKSSRQALANGVNLRWILRTLGEDGPFDSPILLMSYLNPLMSHGFERLAADADAAGVAGFIVPDLPDEEADPLRAALSHEGLALVQLVTPVTPDARLARLCAKSSGFVYAVTMTGTTGGKAAAAGDHLGAVGAYLDRVRAVSPVPVQAGFGIRRRGDVEALVGHTDGVIVGSALIETLERGDDPVAFIEGLRP